MKLLLDGEERIDASRRGTHSCYSPYTVPNAKINYSRRDTRPAFERHWIDWSIERKFSFFSFSTSVVSSSLSFTGYSTRRMPRESKEYLTIDMRNAALASLLTRFLGSYIFTRVGNRVVSLDKDVTVYISQFFLVFFLVQARESEENGCDVIIKGNGDSRDNLPRLILVRCGTFSSLC